MSGITIEISAVMIEAVLREYETENPGCSGRDMVPDEFASRMRKKLLASVKVSAPPGKQAP